MVEKIGLKEARLMCLYGANYEVLAIAEKAVSVRAKKGISVHFYITYSKQ